MRKFSLLYLFFVLFSSTTLVVGLCASSVQALDTFVSQHDFDDSEDGDADELVNQTPMEEELIHEDFAEYLTPISTDLKITFLQYHTLSSQHLPLGMTKPPNS